MTLRELAPSLWQRVDASKSLVVETIAEADGIMFLCPLCFAQSNNGDVGVHSILCWRPRVGSDAAPGPGRWEFVGDSIDDVSFVAGSSSVKLTSGCCAHFFVRDGQIVFC